jgi:hypothetical protein
VADDGTLQFLFRPEQAEDPALAHPGGRGESGQREAVDSFHRGEGGCSLKDRLARPIPI